METAHREFLAPRTRTIQGWICLVAPLGQGHTPFLLLPPPPTSPRTVLNPTSFAATTHAGRRSAVFVATRPARNINKNIKKPKLADNCNCSHTISTTITSPAGAQAQLVDPRHISPTPRCLGPTPLPPHRHNPRRSQPRRLQLRISQPRQPRSTPAP